MDHFKEYLAAEVALDHAAGHLSRREALRQMGMMGIGLTAASAILAACGDDKDPETTAPAAQATTLGAYAAATGAKGAVVVIHENRGLVDNIKAVASRFAGDGYSALAVDLLSEEGGTAKVPSGEVSAALTNAGVSRARRHHGHDR